MNFKGKKILVTGGSGFIGQHLINKLLSLDAKVENYDKNDGLDIQNAKQLGKFIKRRYEVIFHLAGFSGSAKSNENIEKSFRINAFATLNIYELLVKYSPKTKLILSSSRLEYGNPQYLPVDEKHSTNPTSAYGLSKLTASLMSLVYFQKDNLDVTIFRTSNVYGPHKKNSKHEYNIVNYFIDLAKKNLSLPIYGDGEQHRDYIYVDDFVSALLLATAKRSKGEIYNLGYGKGIKFKDMAKLIVQISGKGKLKFIRWPDEFKQVETGSYISNITKIKKDLGFKPKVNFRQGIRKTLQLSTNIWLFALLSLACHQNLS